MFAWKFFRKIHKSFYHMGIQIKPILNTWGKESGKLLVSNNKRSTKVNNLCIGHVNDYIGRF